MNAQAKPCRTMSEIAKRLLESRKKLFEGEVYLKFLDYEHAKPVLKEGIKPEDWDEPLPLTREAVLAEMRSYMIFAREKVQDHRGISACRSVEKMRAWIFVLGDDDCTEDVDHAQYGAPILKAICERYDFPMPDDERTLRMMRGARCVPACEQGCGI